jgi:enoyl-CoA hydratase/carnithine racemase
VTEELEIERGEHAELWLLRRPSRRNALSLALLDRLDEARAAAQRSVVVLAAHPDSPSFCAGFDLHDLRRLAAEGASTSSAASRLHDVFAAMEAAPFSLVTAIRGAAVGGGVELALLGEVRVAHPDATFTLPPAKLGVVYPRVGLARLEAALGSSLLGAMLTTAASVPATRLERAGVLFSLDEDPIRAALDLAPLLAALSPEARAQNRDLLRAVARQ